MITTVENSYRQRMDGDKWGREYFKNVPKSFTVFETHNDMNW